MSSTRLSAINYTARDWQTIRAALISDIQARFPDDWRDFYISGVGMALLEMVAYIGDLLSYYLDIRANEAFLPTAQFRESLLNLGKWVGYQMRPATSAAVIVGASIEAVQARDVIIPIDTLVQSAGGVTFRTIAEGRIPVGSLAADVTFVEGVAQSDSFTSDGTTFQEVKLTVPSVIDNAITVRVDGEEWSEVKSLVYSAGTDQVYTVEYDDDDYGYLQFGDGDVGQIPPNGATIDVEYRVGGGVVGNIAVGELSTTIQGYLDGISPTSYVDVTLYNEQVGSGGEARETTEHARRWIPAWVSANGRAVTEADFNVLANAFRDPTYGAPAYASAWLKYSVPEYNTVVISLWSRDHVGDLTAPSQGLKDAIDAYFNNNSTGAVRIVCTDVEVQDGDIVWIDLDIAVTLESDFASSEVATDVATAVRTLFTGLTPGEDLHLSHLYDAIQGVAGVASALIDSAAAYGRTTETIGRGNAVDVDFTATLTLEPNLPIVANTVRVTAGSGVTLNDNGEGILVGSGGSGYVVSTTGEVSVTFDSAPASGQAINVTYGHVLDYQRGELEMTMTGATAVVTGAVDYPPVVPWHPTLHQKGIAFSDGIQVVTDDGAGNLVGDVDPSYPNRIDVTGGGYSFRLLVTPVAGATIYSTYRQRLETPSENLPMAKHQVAAPGTINVTTQSADQE